MPGIWKAVCAAPDDFDELRLLPGGQWKHIEGYQKAGHIFPRRAESYSPDQAKEWFVRNEIDIPDVLLGRDKKPKRQRQPSEKPKKTRRRKSRVAELLLVLLEDRQNCNLKCIELAETLKCSVSAVSRAMTHKEYGPKIMKIYRDFGIRPPGIHQI